MFANNIDGGNMKVSKKDKLTSYTDKHFYFTMGLASGKTRINKIAIIGMLVEYYESKTRELKGILKLLEGKNGKCVSKKK